jgi:hypothetical protein
MTYRDPAEKIAIREWMHQAMATDPHCWFCGIEVVWDEALKTTDHARPPDWPTYDHLISRMNTDRNQPERLAAGGVLACCQCNADRGAWSWLMTTHGARKERGAPYPRAPYPSGHIWVFENDEPGWALLRECERCGMTGRRFFAGGSWWWKGTRDSGWQTGPIRLCADELANRPAPKLHEGFTPGSLGRTRRRKDQERRNKHHWAPDNARLERSCAACGIEMHRDAFRDQWLAWRRPGEQDWRQGKAPTCGQEQRGEVA